MLQSRLGIGPAALGSGGHGPEVQQGWAAQRQRAEGRRERGQIKPPLVLLIGRREALVMAVKNNRMENGFSGRLARLSTVMVP